MNEAARERMRSILETLARTFTGWNDLQVIWGLNPCTDFRKIFLSGSEEIVPGVACTPEERWLSLKAQLAHEAGHLLFTDRTVWESFSLRGRIYAVVLNIVEDARIERAMANAFPGTLRWLRFSNEYVFKNYTGWKELSPPERALRALNAYAVIGRVPDNTEEELDFVRECAPHVDRGRASETTSGAAEAAAEVVRIFLSRYAVPNINPPEARGTYEPAPAPQGSRDPRRKPALPEKVPDEEPDLETRVLEPSGKPPGEAEDGESPREPESSGEPEESDCSESPREPGEFPGSSAETGESGKTSVSEKQDQSTGRAERKPEGLENASKSPEFEEAAVPETPEHQQNGPDSTEEKHLEPFENLGDMEEPPEDVPQPGFPEWESCEEEEFESTEGDSEEEDSEEEEPEFAGSSGEGIEDSGELLTGFDDLLEESARELKTLSWEPASPEHPEFTREEIEKAAAVDLHKGRKLIVEDLPPDPKARSDLEGMLGTLARKTTEEIRKILEGRHQTIRRNLRKGSLDPSSLWKVPLKEPDIFLKKDLPGEGVDLAVYLLIDCSGSMCASLKGPWPLCRERIHYAAAAGFLMHMVCRDLNISHAAAAFTTDYKKPNPEPAVHFALKKFSGREGSIEALFVLNEERMGNNADGFSIRAAAKELSARPEKKKVLFVISDGLPNCPGYIGTAAVKDTARAVREAEKMGIGVIGVYIGDSNPNVKLMYPNHIILNAGDLPTVIARTLKKVITGPA